MSGAIVKLNRRDFLRLGLASGAGLVLGLRLAAAASADAGATFVPNAFVRIAADDSVTVIAKHIEFGQGTYTGLATLVADELDADWAQIRVEAAPADAARYANLDWGRFQGTGGSSAMHNSWPQMRMAGATARVMLVAAAAAQWQVPAGEITVTKGVVRHAASQREARFGALAAAAATQAVPPAVSLKQPAAFTLIGHDVARVDQIDKTSGRAVYTQDIQLPGMLTALVSHPPRFGARLARHDDRLALAVKGVVAVLPLTTGVAVVAESFWAAKKGRDALVVAWDDTAAVKINSVELLAQYRALATKPGRNVRRSSDAAGVLSRAAQRLSATYEFPYLAHASMEPMNCVAQITGDGCELWYGAQSITGDQMQVGRALGLSPAQVKINMLYAGGSFGRRADPNSDYVLEAVAIAAALGQGRAVKLVWTREDDMRGGRYRPAALHTLRAAQDDQGHIAAWQHRIVSQSILAGTPFASADTDPIDGTTHEGASDLPYAIAHVEVDVHVTAPGVPVLWWRAVGHSHTAFAVESFIDELAHAAGHDPLAFRLTLLADDPRRRAVLELAAHAAGWGTPLAAGRGRGIAVHRSFRSTVAEVAEVTMHEDGSFKVDRVTVAVDCGIAVNPDIVRAQMEGAIGYGLSAALSGAVTLRDGVVEQDNFDTYPVLRMAQMPQVDVHIVSSTAAPTGVGEPGLPPLAPAVANALFAASGKRYRRLPFSLGADG